MNMMTSPEEKWKQNWYSWKLILMRPILWALAKMHITPNQVSVVGLIAMIGFPIFIAHNPKIAALLLAIHLFLDGFIDGSLARYLNQSSNRGKLVDVLCDAGAFELFVIGIYQVSFIDATSALLLAFGLPMVKVLAVLRNQKSLPAGDWIMNPSIGVFPVAMTLISYGIFFVSLAYYLFVTYPNALDTADIHKAFYVIITLIFAKGMQYIGRLLMV